MNLISLSNPPSLYHALAYCLGAILQVQLLPKRVQGWKLLGMELAFLAMGLVFCAVTDVGNALLYVPILLGMLSLMFAAIFACCRTSPRNTLYFTLRAFAVGEFTASMEWQLFVYGAGALPAKLLPAWNVACLLLTHAALFAALYLLEARNQERTRFEAGWRDVFHTFLITLGVYLLSNVSYVYEDALFASGIPQDIRALRTLVGAAGVLMLHAQHARRVDLDRRLEIEMLRQTVETQYANYRVHEQSMELVNRKYHDLKHQIAYLRGEMTDEQRSASLDRMEAELASFEVQAETGNRVLDAICSAKLLQCQGAGIEMICDIDGALLDFLDPMDLSALFGNALDNAIEGAGTLPKEQKPSIRARVYEKRGFILIEIGNSCAGAPSFEDGLPRSTKGDPRYHGFGTKSILETAKKYGGSASFSARDGWFELKVLLPKPQGAQ